MQAVESDISNVLLRRQLLGVQFVESTAASVDFLAEEASSASKQPQLQTVVAAVPDAKCGQDRNDAGQSEGGRQYPEYQRLSFLQDRVVRV